MALKQLGGGGVLDGQSTDSEKGNVEEEACDYSLLRWQES